jgi:hypothetical protein
MPFDFSNGKKKYSEKNEVSSNEKTCFKRPFCNNFSVVFFLYGLLPKRRSVADDKRRGQGNFK